MPKLVGKLLCNVQNSSSKFKVVREYLRRLHDITFNLTSSPFFPTVFLHCMSILRCRCVLVAASPYFQSMFEESHFAEASSREIELKSLTSAGLEAVLDLIYTGIYSRTCFAWNDILIDHSVILAAIWSQSNCLYTYLTSLGRPLTLPGNFGLISIIVVQNRFYYTSY